MTQYARLHLFQGYGVELEYMIVDRDTLQIKSIADELLKHELHEYGSDFENGVITWSNELVTHVVELKSTKPEVDFDLLKREFHENITKINCNSQNGMPCCCPRPPIRSWIRQGNKTMAARQQ